MSQNGDTGPGYTSDSGNGSEGGPVETMIPFRDLINSTGTAMGIIDDSGTVLVANEIMAGLTGMSIEEMEGKVTWTRFIPEDDLKMMSHYHSLRSKGEGDPPSEYDFKFKKWNGDIIHARMHIKMIPGSKLRIFSIIDDERNFRMQKELKDRENLLSRKLEDQVKVQDALFQLTTDPRIIEGDLISSIKPITELIAELLDVDRVSVWSLVESDSILRSMDLYERCKGQHSSGHELMAKEYPSYFDGLRYSPVVDADDAFKDERTSEFSEGYLDVLDIRSMLDAGIWMRGELIGAICIESVGAKRTWSMDEKRLAYEIADHLSILFMADSKKITEARIKDLKEFNESLINTMTDGIIIENQNGTITFANPAMSALLGSPRGVIEGSHWTSIVPNEMVKVVEEASAKREEGSKRSYEIELLRSDGNRVPVLVSGVPNFEGGKYRGQLAIFTDIRELKQVQSDLEVRKAYFQNLFENLPEAVVLVDNHGRIKLSNKEFSNLFGYNEEECLDQNVDDLIVPIESKEYSLQLTLDTARGIRKDEEVIRKKKDGTLVDVNIVSAPIMVGDGQIGVYAIYRDISKRKYAERALTDERNRSEFYLDLLSHDIGNLHQGIYTALQLSRIKESDESTAKTAFETAEELVQRSIHLVKNVIFLANIDTRKVQTKSVEIISMLEDSLSHVMKLFPTKKIIIELDLPKEPIYIDAETIVEELFFNILHNGLKFQRDDKSVIGIKAREEGKRVFVEIYDHGPGIPQDKKAQMFHRFEKGGSLAHMGLGLSLVKALADLYGGNIEVKDRVEGVREWGTSFVIDFPVVPAPKNLQNDL